MSNCAGHPVSASRRTAIRATSASRRSLVYPLPRRADLVVEVGCAPQWAWRSSRRPLRSRHARGRGRRLRRRVRLPDVRGGAGFQQRFRSSRNRGEEEGTEGDAGSRTFVAVLCRFQGRVALVSQIAKSTAARWGQASWGGVSKVPEPFRHALADQIPFSGEDGAWHHIRAGLVQVFVISPLLLGVGLPLGFLTTSPLPPHEWRPGVDAPGEAAPRSCRSIAGLCEVFLVPPGGEMKRVR